MTTQVRRALFYSRGHRDAYVRTLGDLVSIPTVSADPVHAPDVRRAAHQLARHLHRIGLSDVAVVSTARHPVVHAAWRGAPGRPTLLMYGHYDVQPAGSRSAWTSPPFSMRRVGERVVGRGVSDDKGQLLAHLAALEAYLRTTGALPINVVCVLDGEEEIGSPHLPNVLRRLSADVALVSDTRMLGPDQPVITSALRGMVAAELTIVGAERQRHSGTYGGAVPNPANVLCRLISSLHDTDGRIAVPAFYRDVRRLSKAGRDVDAARCWGEPGFTAFERTTIRPALDVHGITSGRQGHGGSSIIPSAAMANLGLRLVAYQRPDHVVRLLHRHFAAQSPCGVSTTFQVTKQTPPVWTNVRHSAVDAAARACRRVFGVAPVLLPSGGTIAAVSQLRTVLGLETVLLGFALPDDGAHGPNESAHLPTLFRAVDTCIWLLHELSLDDRTCRST